MRKLAGYLLLAFCVVIALPILELTVNAGTLFIAPFGLLAMVLLHPKFCKSFFNKNKWIKNMLTFLYIIFAVTVIALSSLMAVAAAKPLVPSDTVVVLGCKVTEDGPSDMLLKRIKKASEYLKEHPEAVAIATGGVNGKTGACEAETIREYLIADGIEESRIFTEPNAKSTKENFMYSAEIIENNGLSKDAVVVTNGFHQYRAAYFADMYGLNASPFCSKTTPVFAVACWLRETLAVMRMLILKY